MFLLSSCQEAFFEEEHDLGKLATNEDIRIVLNGAWEQLNSQYYWDMYIRMISRGDDFVGCRFNSLLALRERRNKPL